MREVVEALVAFRPTRVTVEVADSTRLDCLCRHAPLAEILRWTNCRGAEPGCRGAGFSLYFVAGGDPRPGGAMLQESRDRIVSLYHLLRDAGTAEFDRQLADRSYCMFDDDQRRTFEEVFDLVFRRRRDRAQIQLRMPPPGEEVEVVLDDEVRVTVEVDLRDRDHLMVDGLHVPDLEAVTTEIMDQAVLALEE